MLIDMHAHTSGISRCCRADAPEILTIAKNSGLDGIILTNHYQKCYLDGGKASDFAKKYVNEYLYTAECAEKIGIRTAFGAELTPEFDTRIHLLMYDIPFAAVLENPEMWELPLEEIYRLAKGYGGTLIQAHPFRNGATVLNTAFLDGIEVNCHPVYKISYREKIFETAKDADVAVSCGGDFHKDTYRPKCGVYFESGTERFGESLLKMNKTRLLVHEPNEDEPIEYIFEKNKKEE